MSRGVGSVRGVLGASRDSRYSGTRRGIGGIRGIGGSCGCREPLGGIRGISECKGVSGVYWLASRDSQVLRDQEGYRGHQDH